MESEKAVVSAEARLLVDALHRLGQPVRAGKLWAKVKGLAECPSEKRVPELLQELVRQGQVRSHGKPAAYWLPQAEAQAQERICAALARQVRSRSALEKDLGQWLREWPPKVRLQLLDRLIQQGRIRRWPGLGRNRSLLGVPGADAQMYVQGPWQAFNRAMADLAKKLAPVGVTSAQLQQIAQTLWQATFPATEIPLAEQPAVSARSEPASEPNYSELILTTMPQIEAAALSGALVSLTRLRARLAPVMPEKELFDETVLGLARAGRVVLHRHDYVNSLSPVEQAALVQDARGNFYVGIAFN